MYKIQLGENIAFIHSVHIKSGRLRRNKSNNLLIEQQVLVLMKKYEKETILVF